jgi:D-alanine-D-alanine ligase
MMNIAVIAGGDTQEYEISIKSAKRLMECIDRTRYTPWLVIYQNGNFSVQIATGKIPLHSEIFGIQLKEELIRFELAYNITHGSPGEDGLLAGYLEMRRTPYTSPGVLASAITMDKYLCKKLVASLRIPVAKDICLHKNDAIIDIDSISEHIGFPFFVKPNSGGSSVATFKVKTKADAIPAIEAAFEVDEWVIVESFLPGRELTIGIFYHNGEILTLPPTEIKPHNEFFDYQAKYEGASDEITPAHISTSVLKKLQRYSQKIYHLLKLNGLVRIDFILNDKGLYFMEVNTIPGFSEASIVPQQIRAAGLNETELISAIIEDTRRRFDEKWNA